MTSHLNRRLVTFYSRLRTHASQHPYPSSRFFGQFADTGVVDVVGVMSTHFFLLPAGNPKQRILGPMAIATNCLPFTMYVMGEALFSEPAGKCHRGFPVRSSKATKSPGGSP